MWYWGDEFVVLFISLGWELGFSSVTSIQKNFLWKKEAYNRRFTSVLEKRTIACGKMYSFVIFLSE